MMKRIAYITTLLLFLSVNVRATDVGISGDKFTIDGDETFILGASYFDGNDWSEADFEYLEDNGFNLIRIWLDWRDDSFFDPDGTIGPGNASNLLDLVRTADGHGIVVDVTILSVKSFDGDLQKRENALRSAVSLLKDETNIIYDVMNEHTISTSTKFPLPLSDVRTFIDIGHSLDSDGLFTASYWANPINYSYITDLVNNGGIEFLAIHFHRTCDWGVNTGNRVTYMKNHIASLGKNIPLYLQEPHRRHFNEIDCSVFRENKGTYNLPYPYKADFFTAAKRAADADAAGWVFHSNASYELESNSLYENYDDIEKDVVSEIRHAAYGQNGTVDMFDPLDGSTIGEQIGGIFTGGGWEPTSNDNKIIFKLPTTIANPGYVEVEVSNFDPLNQCSVAKSSFLSLYDSSHGDIATAAYDEYSTRVVTRIGTNYGSNLLLKGTPGLFDPIQRTVDTTFNPSNTYTFRVQWDDDDIWWTLNGNMLATIPFGSRAQYTIDYLFLGTDGSGLQGSCPGPIYRNLRVYSYGDALTYECSDGLDNDNDGLTDYPGDPGCTSTTDDDEHNQISSNGMIGYWQLDGDASDVYGNDGTINGGSFVDGIFGGAMYFDGIDDFIEIPHIDDYLTDEGTVSLWFKPDQSGVSQHMFSKDALNKGTGGHFYISLNNTGNLKTRIQSTLISTILESDSVLVNDEWHHVVVTFGSSGFRLYLDGIPERQDPYSSGMGTTSGGSGNHEPIAIGAGTGQSTDLSVTPTTNHFMGSIDDVRIYDYALTPEEVSGLATHHMADTSPPYGCVSMDEIMDFMDLWLQDSTSYPMPELMNAIKLYYYPVNSC